MVRKGWIFMGMLVAAGLFIAGGVLWLTDSSVLAQAPPLEPSEAQTGQVAQPAISPPAGWRAGRIVRGTVTGVLEEEVQIENREGEAVTLLITDSTRQWTPGQPVTATWRLETGDSLLALGTPAPAEDGARALAVRWIVVAGEEELPQYVLWGRVEAVTRQTVVITTTRGESARLERAITVLPRTRIWTVQGRQVPVRYLQHDDRLLALGRPTEAGQWIAGAMVVTSPQALAQRTVRGVVAASDTPAATLTVKTPDGDRITVVANDSTRIRIPGVEAPAFAGLQIGDSVAVLGRFEGEEQATFLARGIAVLRP
jgi:hypothetical protein